MRESTHEATTGRYQSLHELSSEQVRALSALAGGATHEVAAGCAGVHRVTVTRWVNHHPAFIAELHQLRLEAARDAAALVVETTRRALRVVSDAVEEGNLDAAFRWLRLGTLASVAGPTEGPADSHQVVERVRATMPDFLTQMLAEGGPTSADAEAALLERLGA
jgi:hypothetical protein